MRILHINGNYIYSSVHRTMIRHMTDAGIENLVFVPTYEGMNEQTDLGANVCVRECFCRRDRLWFGCKQNKILRGVQETIADKPPFQLIHAYTLFTDGNCAMRLSRQLGIPYVVAVRNTDVSVFFKYMVHLRRKGIEVLEGASAVFFLSSAYRDHVIGRYVPRRMRESILKKSFLIPNGIDDFWFENQFDRNAMSDIHRIEEERRVNVLYVGEINENKNLLLTARAIRQLNESGWNIRYTSVGKVSDAGILEKLQQFDFFCHVPPKPKEELLNEYRKADLFVMPSHTETFGLTYAEAMSQGLPVIYTRGQGFDGQFPEGMVGYSVNSRDAAELADNIVKICNRYTELSRNCVQNVQNFRWNAIVSNYLRIYGMVEQSNANGDELRCSPKAGQSA